MAIFLKGLILFLRPGLFLNFLSAPLLITAHTLRLTKWIAAQPKAGILNDFYTPFRDHSKRYQLYEYIFEREKLANDPIHYLEFGVFQGSSFKWWIGKNKNPDSEFYGFDTFEGLPENWGTYAKGEMGANIPVVDDSRHEFLKGLFQDTLFPFLETHKLGNKRMIIHLDADLFSSTLFVLTTLSRFIKKDDIVLFDEFNVPNHEYLAFKYFTESFYMKFELLGAVNNFYQVAFKVI